MEEIGTAPIEIGAGESLVLTIAGQHPLEWIGVEAALAFADQVRATPRLAQQRHVIVPVVNQDGYRAVEADLRAGRRRYRRKSLAGTDLNRDWFAQTEPAVRAVTQIVDDHVARGGTLALAISLHSFGRKLLVPWGRSWFAPPHVRRSRTLAAIVQSRLSERYEILQASHWLPGPLLRGLEIDHFHAAYGAPAILVECSRGGLRARDPRTWITPFHWYNPPDPAPIARDLARALVAACETLA